MPLAEGTPAAGVGPAVGQEVGHEAGAEVASEVPPAWQAFIDRRDEAKAALDAAVAAVAAAKAAGEEAAATLAKASADVEETARVQELRRKSEASELVQVLLRIGLGFRIRLRARVSAWFDLTLSRCGAPWRRWSHTLYAACTPACACTLQVLWTNLPIQRGKEELMFARATVVTLTLTLARTRSRSRSRTRARTEL